MCKNIHVFKVINQEKYCDKGFRINQTCYDNKKVCCINYKEY